MNVKYFCVDKMCYRKSSIRIRELNNCMGI